MNLVQVEDGDKWLSALHSLPVLDVELCVPLQHGLPHAWHGDDCQNVEHVKDGDDDKDDEPEPKGDVDLLVDDVQSKNAHSIVLLDSTCAEETFKSAHSFGDTKDKNLFTYYVILFDPAKICQLA